MSHDSAPEDDFVSRFAKASVSHGYLLALLERMRRSSLEEGAPAAAWSFAVVEHLLCELPFGTPEHMALHNVVAEFVERGIGSCDPPAAAVTAYEVHGADL